MATTANITLNHLDAPFTASVSHDGQPATMMPLLALFNAIGTKATPSDLKAMYLHSYAHIPNCCVTFELGISQASHWDYEITTAEDLEVVCNTTGQLEKIGVAIQETANLVAYKIVQTLNRSIEFFQGRGSR